MSIIVTLDNLETLKKNVEKNTEGKKIAKMFFLKSNCAETPFAKQKLCRTLAYLNRAIDLMYDAVHKQPSWSHSGERNRLFYECSNLSNDIVKHAAKVHDPLPLDRLAEESEVICRAICKAMDAGDEK